MKLNIYNRFDEAVEVDTVDKEIDFIRVEVISENELIHIVYSDRTTEHYKSYTPFIVSYDGGYRVSKERIQEWIELEKEEIPEGYSIGKYRLEKFTREKEK